MKATATRDMQQLLELGAFTLSGKAGGRSTSYQVNIKSNLFKSRYGILIIEKK